LPSGNPYIRVKEVGLLKLEKRVLGWDQLHAAVLRRGRSPADRGEAAGTALAVRSVHPERSLRAGGAARVPTCLGTAARRTRRVVSRKDTLCLLSGGRTGLAPIKNVNRMGA